MEAVAQTRAGTVGRILRAGVEFGVWLLVLGCGGAGGSIESSSTRDSGAAEGARTASASSPPPEPARTPEALESELMAALSLDALDSTEAGWLRECPAPMPEWVAADTGGPPGERVLGCLKRIGSATDDRIPMDQVYELTTFGNPGDEQPTNCEEAPDADGTWYYAANRQRFGCGTRFRLTDAARTRCVVVEVADLGPNICVEEAGGRPAWDVSPLAAKHLFGVSRAGWSEHRRVLGARVADDTPLGPCDEHLAGAAGLRSLDGGVGARAIGAACSQAAPCDAGATCLGDELGWPAGYCTQGCTDSCPTRVGAYPSTFCAEMPNGVGQCLARCDFTLFEGGCRPGYACRFASAPGGGSSEPVCTPLPEACASP